MRYRDKFPAGRGKRSTKKVSMGTFGYNLLNVHLNSTFSLEHHLKKGFKKKNSLSRGPVKLFVLLKIQMPLV